MWNNIMTIGLGLCVVLWVSSHLLRGRNAKLAEILGVAAAFFTLILILMAVVDIISESEASGWSWAVIVLVLICWIYWSCTTPERLSKRYHDIFYEDHHNIVFRKHYDDMHDCLGDEISAFLDKHHMAEGYFTSVILEPAVRNKMEEYDALHRD